MSNTHKKGDGEPKAASHETQSLNTNAPTSSIDLPSNEPAGKVNNNDEIPTVKTEFDGIEYPELAGRAQAIKQLDSLLVQNEARGTIYELALGLQVKQVKTTLKSKGLKGKKLRTAFDGYMSGLKLSAARSPRTIQRYVQLVEEMTDDDTLTNKIRDALKAANFSEDIQTEVLQLTDGKGITKLYEKYGMVSEKPHKDKVEKTTEEKLMDEVIAIVKTHNKLMRLRGDLVAAGDDIDPALDELIDKTCDAARAIANHPVINAMLKKLEEEEKAKKEANA